MLPPPTSLPLCWACLGTDHHRKTDDGVGAAPSALKEGFQGLPWGSLCAAQPGRVTPSGRAGGTAGQSGTLAGQGSGAPTGRRGQLQGRLRIAVLAAVHRRALHVGASIQQQLPRHTTGT